MGWDPGLVPERTVNDQRRRNAARVLQTLLRSGPQPRIDIASMNDLSTGAVSRITRELTDLGLVTELEPVESSEVGRRRIPLDLNASKLLTVGVNIGYDSLIYGLVDARGGVVGSTRLVKQGQLDAADTVEQVVALVGELVGDLPADAVVLGTGISVGALVDSDSGVVTDRDLMGWQGVNIIDLFRDRLPGLTAVDTVYRAVARAEGWFAAARHVESFVQLFARHAIGAAFVLGGADYVGVGGRAGSIAHLPVSGRSDIDCLCGREACLTSMASFGAVLQRVYDLGFSIRGVEELAQLSGRDPRVAEIVERRNTALGEGIASIINMLAPELVVLSISAMSTADLAVIRTVATSYLTLPRDVSESIVPSTLGRAEDANVIGTATAVLSRFYDDPIGHLRSIR